MMKSAGMNVVSSAAEAIFHHQPSRTTKPQYPSRYGIVETTKSITPLKVDLARARSSKLARTSLTDGAVGGSVAETSGTTSGVGVITDISDSLPCSDCSNNSASAEDSVGAR